MFQKAQESGDVIWQAVNICCAFIFTHSFILQHVFNECFLCARHFARHWGCDVGQHIIPGREEADGSVLWVKQTDLRVVLIDKMEKEMATHFSILAWRIPWMEEPGGLQSTRSQKVRHD